MRRLEHAGNHGYRRPVIALVADQHVFIEMVGQADVAPFAAHDEAAAAALYERCRATRRFRNSNICSCFFQGSVIACDRGRLKILRLPDINSCFKSMTSTPGSGVPAIGVTLSGRDNSYSHPAPP